MTTTSPPRLNRPEPMNDAKSDYVLWIKDLIKTCLPLELQKKILTRTQLTREETKKVANVLILAGQARQIAQGDTTNASLTSLDRKVDRLLKMGREQIKNERTILWYTSSEDPQFKPDSTRTASAIRRVMVQYAQALIRHDGTLSERSAANIVIGKFVGVEGAYGPDDLETFRRQLNRKNPLE